MGKGENGMGKMATGEGVEEDRSKGGMESEKGDVLRPLLRRFRHLCSSHLVHMLYHSHMVLSSFATQQCK